jgi:hypothetical protein
VSGSTKEISNLALRFDKFFNLISSLRHNGEICIPKLDVVEGKIVVSNIPC